MNMNEAIEKMKKIIATHSTISKQTLLMSPDQFLGIAEFEVPTSIDYTSVAKYASEVGHAYGRVVVETGKVESCFKRKADCGCEQAITDVFCVRCAMTKARDIYDRRKSDERKAYIAKLQENADDIGDAALMDAHEQCLELSMREAITEALTTDRLMDMVMRGHAYRKHVDGKRKKR